MISISHLSIDNMGRYQRDKAVNFVQKMSVKLALGGYKKPDTRSGSGSGGIDPSSLGR